MRNLGQDLGVALEKYKWAFSNETSQSFSSNIAAACVAESYVMKSLRRILIEILQKNSGLSNAFYHYTFIKTASYKCDKFSFTGLSPTLLLKSQISC